jgi:hypothetical protein
VHYEDVAVGFEIPTVSKGPLTTAHVVRWSAAMENWAPIHYDWRYATEHDGLPDVLVNGSWKQHVLMQALNDWIGEDGWLWKMNFQYRGMTVPGDGQAADESEDTEVEEGEEGTTDDAEATDAEYIEMPADGGETEDN